MSDIQGSAEWLKSRIGKVTASRVVDVMAKTKTGPSASRKNYLAELLCERLTGQQAEFFVNDAMRHGTETEPLARSAYEIKTGKMVIECGLISHPTIEGFGASPDGLIDDDGGLEIKCPNTATHLETILGGGIPSKYMYQMQTGMACTGRKWWDYVTFDPRLPEHLQMRIYRVTRDDAMIIEIEREVKHFLNELDEMIYRLQNES